ncbi:MAG: hypothetical protein WBP37_15810 [Candidatus Dechloromonas phosphoritropha]|jgi:hypothetical protein
MIKNNIFTEEASGFLEMRTPGAADQLFALYHLGQTGKERGEQWGDRVMWLLLNRC